MIIRFIFIFIVVFCSISFTEAFKNEKTKNNYILILSSYDYDNEWGTQIAKNVRREIEAIDDKLFVNICYADIGKRNSFSSDRLGMQGAFSSGKINSSIYLPSVLVLIGDESWMLYRIMNLRGKWGNVPIVLCGVHSEIMNDYSLFYKNKNFADSSMIPLQSSSDIINYTAILLPDNTGATVNLIKTLIPNATEINYITTGNYQDEYELSLLQRVLQKQHPTLTLRVHQKSENNADSLHKKLAALPNNSVILVRNAANDPKVNVPTFTLHQYDLYGSNLIGGYNSSLSYLSTQTAQMVSKLHNRKSSFEFSFVDADQVIPRLNMEAIKNHNLSSMAESIPNVIYSNIPASFFVKHFRIIMIISLIIIIIATLIVFFIRSANYQKKVIKSHNRYKGLYDEYSVVYEHMPLGLILFDSDGKMTNSNEAASKFLNNNNIKSNYDFDTINQLNNPYFETQCSEIVDEKNGKKNKLLVIFDNTEEICEREAKTKILDKMVFAMETSGWGVSQYNILTGTGFASNAWKAHLGLKGDFSFRHSYDNIMAGDREKIEDFINKAAIGKASHYTDNIHVVIENKEYCLHHVMLVMKYAPMENQIIVVQLIINIDDQQERERRIMEALAKVRKSYKLKNAFIANTGEQMRDLWGDLSKLIDELLDAQTPDKRQSKYQSVDQLNSTMLDMLGTIIDISKEESAKMENNK